MPGYCFHLETGDSVRLDLIGIDVPDLAQAAVDVIASIRDTRNAYSPAQRQEMSILVVDEEGATVLVSASPMRRLWQ